MPATRVPGPPARRPLHTRVLRWARPLAILVILGLAAATLARIVWPDPSVGHWRSSDGRHAYVQAYDRAMGLLPGPTLTRDIPTSLGSVRAYGWTSPEHRERTPVVLLPGMMSGTPQWAEQVADIAARRDVYTFDALGDTGLSPQTVPMTRYEDQAVWVEETLGGLGLARAHVVGHSFGGATGMIHAQRHPERVATLTLLEPAFTLDYPPPSIFFWATVATLPVPGSWRDRALAEIGGVEPEEVAADEPVGRMIALGSEHFSGALPTPSPRDDATLRALPMPVYVGIAERSSLAGGQEAAQRARLIPRARVETWPDTTHSLPFQTGPALVERLDAWWSESETGR